MGSPGTGTEEDCELPCGDRNGTGFSKRAARALHVSGISLTEELCNYILVQKSCSYVLILKDYRYVLCSSYKTVTIF